MGRQPVFDAPGPLDVGGVTTGVTGAGGTGAGGTGAGGTVVVVVVGGGGGVVDGTGAMAAGWRRGVIAGAVAGGAVVGGAVVGGVVVGGVVEALERCAAGAGAGFGVMGRW